MSDLADGLRGLAAVVEQLETMGVEVAEAEPVGWADATEHDGRLTADLLIGVPVGGVESQPAAEGAAPERDDTAGESSDDSAEDTTDGGRKYCGRCGDGPMTEHGVRIHTPQVHGDVEAIVRDTEPDANELVGAEGGSEERWCGVCGYGPSSADGVRRHHGMVHDGEPDVAETPPVGEDESEEQSENPYAPEDLGTVTAKESEYGGGNENGTVIHLPPRVIDALPGEPDRCSVFEGDGAIDVVPGVDPDAVMDYAISYSDNGTGDTASISTTACRTLGVAPGDEFRAEETDAGVRLVPIEGTALTPAATDDDTDPEPAETDGGTAPIDAQAPQGWTDYDGGQDQPATLDSLDLPIPEAVDADALRQAAAEHETIRGVCEALEWDDTGRVRAALFRLDLYGALDRPEGHREPGADWRGEP